MVVGRTKWFIIICVLFKKCQHFIWWKRSSTGIHISRSVINLFKLATIWVWHNEGGRELCQCRSLEIQKQIELKSNSVNGNDGWKMNVGVLGYSCSWKWAEVLLGGGTLHHIIQHISWTWWCLMSFYIIIYLVHCTCRSLMIDCHYGIRTSLCS